MRCKAIALAAIGASLASPGSVAADSLPTYSAGTVVGQVPAGTCCVSQIAVADFNGDRLDDAIFTRSVFLGQDTFPITVLLNDGSGKFVDGTSAIFTGSPPVTQNARELVVAELNGDGRPDVFVADHGDDRNPFPGFQNTLILSTPNGKLVDATANLPQQSDFTHSADAGDVNGDGKADVYSGNLASGSGVPPQVLLNDGSGQFSVASGVLPPAQTSAGRYTTSLFADMNTDGKADLVLGGEDQTPASAVLLNDGAGHLIELADALPAKPFGASAIALDIAALDVNGDPHTDLLIAFTKGDPFYVGRWTQLLVNNGDGTFRDETASRLPQTDNSDAWPVFFRLRDLTRDGRTDFGIVVSSGFDPSANAPLFAADASGAFHAGPAAPVGSLWTFVDARGDGSHDVLSVNQISGVVTLFSERGGLPPEGTPKDVAPPRLRLIVKRVHRLRKVIRRGLPLTVGCSEACTFGARLVLALPRRPRAARTLTAGRASGRLAAAGRKAVRVKLRRRARAALRGRRKAALTLRVTATDRALNTARTSRRIVLKR